MTAQTTLTAAAPVETAESGSLTPWLVCFSAALFFFYEFIQMTMFNAISTDLMREFSISGTELGVLSSTYLYADVVFLFPAGMILDRVSTRSVILVAMLVCVGSTLAFALSHNVYFAGGFHFLAGIGNAFCFLSCIMLASRWFPPRRQALVIGLMVTMAMFGGVAAQWPLTRLSEAFGWRGALQLDALLGAAIMLLIWFFVRDYPADQAEKRKQERAQLQNLGFGESIRLALSNSQNWFCGLYTSFLNLPIMTLGAVWGGVYLTQVHHLTLEKASAVTTMIFVGTIIGSPVAGLISDRMSLRRLPMLIGAILSMAVIAALMYLPTLSYHNLLVLFFLLGLFTSTQVISYPMITESNSRMLTGTSMGLASVLIMGGGALSQPLFGWLLDYGWNGTLVDGAPLYAPANYLLALSMIPATFVVGYLFAWFTKETNCKPFDETTQA